MPIKTKRWCDARKADDGYRLLICRYRPRALPKADETWDNWCADLGPSKELAAEFYGKHGPPISLALYLERYLQEMTQQKESIDELAALVEQGQTVTLLCSSACTDPAHCHRTVLKELIEQRIEERRQTQ